MKLVTTKFKLGGLHVAAYHVVWECVVEQWLGVRRTTHTLATAPQHNMICCHNTSFANTNRIVITVI